MKYLIFPVVIFLLSLVLTRLVRWYALHHDIMDRPNDRSSHLIATPRGGGVAIVASFTVALLLLLYVGEIKHHLVYALVAGGGIVAFIGFLDDCWSLSASVRFPVHVTASLIALFLLKAWEIELPLIFWLPTWLRLVILCLFLVSLLNLYNFMDGIDGIAAVEAITVSLGMAMIFFVLSQTSAWILLVMCLAGAVSGFLVWNWPPASIFMGDVGSGYLGFVFGVLIIEASDDTLCTPWPWLILLSVFLVDSSYTLAVRLLSGQKWYAAHRSHAYQKAVVVIGSHKAVSMAVLLINVIWLLPLAFASILLPGYFVFVIFSVFFPLFGVAYLLGSGRE